SPRSGLRTFCSADQIAVFEWGASRCSAYVIEVIGAARPGVGEREAFRGVPWGGEPLSYHPVLSSGPDVAVGLRSPSSRRFERRECPMRAGSADPLASGMVIQSDIIPTGIRPGWTANCEDTVAIADGDLRAAIEARHPELWSRITARRAFMRDRLGIEVRDEV